MPAACDCPPLGLTEEYRKRLFWMEAEPGEHAEHDQRFEALSEEELEKWEAIGQLAREELWLDAHRVECAEHPAVFGYFYGWVPTPAGAWIVTGRLALNADGERVIRDFATEPDLVAADAPLGGGGIDGTAMRKIPYAKIREAACARVAVEPDLLAFEERVGWQSPSAEDVDVAERAATAASSGSPRKRGPKGYPNDHYRRIARLYLRLLAQGKRRGILTEIAKREGRKPETIRDWVYEARQRGFLTKRGSPGRAGAGPGPNL